MPQPLAMGLLSIWTVLAVGLTTVVLARPTWFWQFPDPWSGTEVAPAALAWVESWHLRPVIVLVCGSLTLVFARFAPDARAEAEKSAVPPRLTRWLGLVTLAVTVASSVLLALIGAVPDWFFRTGQPWLAWLVTGGAALFALAGSNGWLGAREHLRTLMIGIGFALAAWLFVNTPHDEFGIALSLQNRIVYLVPGVVLLVFHACTSILARGHFAVLPFSLSPILLSFFIALALIVFGRANYLQPLTGMVRAVLCVDAESGELLWNTPLYVAAAEKRHSLNSQATPTPACDGERVYAYFGSGLAALDLHGQVLWLKRDADFPGFIRYGAGSSVALAEGRIIVFRDSEFMGHGDHLEDDIQGQTARRPTALTAHDKATGAELWSIAPSFSHDSYMTPLVWTRNDRQELVIATWKTLASFAVGDGALLWTHAYPMQQIVPSLAVSGDCLIVTGGNILPCPILAVRPPTPSETKGQRVWFNGKTGGNIVSPVCWNGLLFSMSHAGILTCRDADSGRIHWAQRVGSRMLASLVAGDGKVYALDQEGTLHVVAADTTGSVLATHSFLENCSATPAIVDGMLLVRTSGYLYCMVGF